MARTTKIGLLTAALALFAAQPARAGLLPTSVTVTPESGNFRWTYAVVLPTDTKLQSGDYFTIYDFGGLVAGSASAPDGWALSVTKTGPTPDRLNPQDDPNVPNLTWKYSGPSVTGQIGLGNFMVTTTIGTEAPSFFVATSGRSSDGAVDRNITETIVPGTPPSPTPTPGVPEPTTLALAGIGLPVVGLLRMRRRK
jgi:hypothetical protein